MEESNIRETLIEALRSGVYRAINSCKVSGLDDEDIITNLRQIADSIEEDGYEV